MLPKPVAPQVEPSAQAPKPALPGDATRLPAQPGETVIIPQLRSIRIVAHESAITDNPAPPPSPLVIEGIDGLHPEATAIVLDRFIGQPVSRESLDRMLLAIRLLLAQQGRAFSVVYTPPQDITDGLIQIVVVESVVEEIRVEGNRHFSDGSYLSRFPSQSGGPINADAVRTGIDRINRNAFRNAAARVEKGTRPGTSAIVIQAQDRFPLRAFAGYNNTGSEATTVDRVTGGVNWANVFGLGHQMTLQWTSDLTAKHLRAGSGSYSADLPGNHNITFFGAYSEISSTPQGGLEQEGMSWQLGLNYDLALSSSNSAYTHALIFGLDYKSSDNNLELNLPPFLIPISNNLTHIAQGRIAYRGTLRDAGGATTWELKLTGSPGGLGGWNSDEAFSASRAMARPDYLYGNLSISRDTALPFFGHTLSWVVLGELQLSSSNLLSSEMFTAGGSSRARGYEESEVLGDNALYFSQELWLPALRPFSGSGQSDHILRPFAFHDAARLWNVDKLPGERPFNVHSVGVGLNYQFSRHIQLNLAYGWQLKDSGSSDTGDNSRGHISLQASY